MNSTRVAPTASFGRRARAGRLSQMHADAESDSRRLRQTLCSRPSARTVAGDVVASVDTCGRVTDGISRQKTEELRAVMLQRRSEQVTEIHQVMENYRLIADYAQRHVVIEMFGKSVAENSQAVKDCAVRLGSSPRAVGATYL